jgi:hypothetical protein
VSQQQYWRLAIMFDAPGHGLARLETVLHETRDQIGRAVGDRQWRLGVAISGVDHDDATSHDLTGWRTADGAIEVTFAGEDHRSAMAICQAVRPIVAPLAQAGSIEVMIGRLHAMVPPKAGAVFLSLSFRRYAGTTVEQFRDWWLNRHAGIAIPVLGPELLAYDQVHVDDQLSQAAATALGVDFVAYDAYDNLTWQDAGAYARSTGDPASMVVVAQDEDGRIDNNSRRFALMREIA